MPSIPTENLETGMRLAGDVMNPRGQILIPTGTAIEEKHLRGLRAWGVKSVAVTVSSAPDSVLEQSGVTLLSKGEREAFLARMFSLNQEAEISAVVQPLRALASAGLERNGVVRTAAEDTDSVVEDLDAASEKRPTLTVEELIKMAAGIATLPNIYFELQQVMRRPSSASADMANAIRNDPGLTARLLRIVNSAYYSFASKIETVPRAVTIVGTDELISLVTATSVMKSFGVGDDVFDMSVFWRHSIGAGVIARTIAEKRQERNAERFFVMGLLHDIGKILMFAHIPKFAKAASRRSLAEGVQLSQVESEDIGFSHAAVGAALARNWRMSAGQQEAIAHHHRPSFAMRYRSEAAITHLADILSHVMCAGQCPGSIVPPIDIEAWERIGLSVDDLSRILGGAELKVSELVDVFLKE